MSDQNFELEHPRFKISRYADSEKSAALEALVMNYCPADFVGKDVLVNGTKRFCPSVILDNAQGECLKCWQRVTDLTGDNDFMLKCLNVDYMSFPTPPQKPAQCFGKKIQMKDGN